MNVVMFGDGQVINYVYKHLTLRDIFWAIRLAFRAVNKKQETKKEIIVLAAVFIFFMDVIFQG